MHCEGEWWWISLSWLTSLLWLARCWSNLTDKVWVTIWELYCLLMVKQETALSIVTPLVGERDLSHTGTFTHILEHEWNAGEIFGRFTNLFNSKCGSENGILCNETELILNWVIRFFSSFGCFVNWGNLPKMSFSRLNRLFLDLINILMIISWMTTN